MAWPVKLKICFLRTLFTVTSIYVVYFSKPTINGFEKLSIKQLDCGLCANIDMQSLCPPTPGETIQTKNDSILLENYWNQSEVMLTFNFTVNPPTPLHS